MKEIEKDLQEIPRAGRVILGYQRLDEAEFSR